MKTMMVVGLLLALLMMGCGVNKEYVAQQINDSESRTGAQISDLSDKTNANADQITKLQSLSAQLAEKTDLAINKASGFENYQVLWSGEIQFDFDSYDVTPTAEEILLEACEKMGQYPGSLIEIAGHADRTGSARYNLMLGEKRSGSAKRYIADHCGISLYRLFVVSYGETKPVALPDEKQAASKNRRVTLSIWGQM
ncbi:MAG: OmpA family protein [candidate division Zixibacteria bacterium]|nr:OmpA family protein [candidate division Zixibacteria bacterium]